MKCDYIQDGIRLALFDTAVNIGVKRSSRFIQAIVGAKPDGIIGSITLGLIRSKSAGTLRKEFLQRRLFYYAALDDFGRYGQGWYRRVIDVASHSETV